MPYAFVSYEVDPVDLADAVRVLDAAGYVVTTDGVHSRFEDKVGLRVEGAPYERAPGLQVDMANPELCAQTASLLERAGIAHEMNGNGVGAALTVRRLDE